MKNHVLTTVLASLLAGAGQAAITDQLVTHLTFDNTLDDSSGRAHHGTAVGTVGYGAGVVGAGAAQLSFKKDGSSFNYVTLGVPADLNFGTDTDFSVSLWVKFSNWTFDPPFISNKDWLSGQYQGWMIATGTDGRLQWNYGGAPGQRKDYDGPGGTVSDGQWHHVVLTVLRAGEVVTYLDGVVVDERDVSASPNNLDTPAGQAVNIGQDGTGVYTDGNSVEINDLMVDDVGIWRRVVTATEAVAIYNAGKAGQNLATVASSPEAPVLTKHPESRNAVAGENITLRVLPRGTSPFTFEWRRNNQPVAGGTNAVLRLDNIQAAQAGSYVCRVGNGVTTVESNPADVAVDTTQPPTILELPLNLSAAVGARVTFKVRAAGVAPLTFQWFHDGNPVPDANAEALTLTRVKTTDGGSYAVRITSGNGQSVTSAAVTLAIVNDLRQGLVAHLTFDGDYRDTSGRGNHGTPVGNPSLVEGYIGGKALRFSQRSALNEFNFVTLGQAADLEFSVDADFSFSFWVKFSNWQRDPAFISNKSWSSGNNIGYALATGADGRFQWNFTEQVGERRDYDSGPGLISDGRWHHVAVTFQRGGESVCFVDGREMDRQSLPTTGTTISPGLPTNIGQDGTGTYTDNGTVAMEDGTIDDVAIWRRAITPEEIRAIYRKGGFGANVQQRGLDEDLVAWLPFDGDLWDRSGRGNHGTRIGTPRFTAGHSGGAISFTSLKDGSSFNYVTLGAPADLQFGRDLDFSVSFWSRFTNWTGDPVFVGNKDWRSGGNQGFVVATGGNGRLQWNLGDGDAGGRTRKDYDGPGGTISDGQWHHVVTVFDRQDGAVTYLDGNPVSTNEITAGLDSVDAPAGLSLNIGQDGVGTYTDNGAVGIRDGAIDEVAIWRRPLGAAEVRAIFDRGVAGLNLAGQPARPTTLPNGVAAGELAPTSIMLWTRSTAPGGARFEVSPQRDFSEISAQATATVTNPAVPVKVAVGGLTPATRYHYRVVDAAGGTGFGTFKTPAPADTFAGLRFGVSGDARGELAPYPAIANIPARKLDFFVNLGDTIYGDYPSPAVNLPAAKTLEQFRLKHDEMLGQQLGLPSFADLRSSTPVFAMIDDHEVINDFAGGAPAGSDSRFDTRGAFLNDSQLYRNGLQAFTEFNPIAPTVYTTPDSPRTDGKPKLYRSQRFGRDAALFMLDARSFRDEELDGPADPTNPLEVGAFLARSFDVNPLTGQPLPRRTMLGRPQLEDLKAGLLGAETAGVEWKFVLVPEPIQNFGVLAASDRFEGYAAERAELLAFINQQKLRNVVFISADIHGTLINNLTYQNGLFGPQIPTAAFEVVTGAVAFDAPFGPTVLELAGNLPAGSGTLLDQFLGGIGLPSVDAFNLLLTPAQKNAALESLVNAQVAPLGYSPVGLADAPFISKFQQGGATAVFTYGWTEFEIAPDTLALRITTYGIPPYTQAGMNADVLLRAPAVVSQFTVEPDVPRLAIRRDGALFRLAWKAVLTGHRLEVTTALGGAPDWQPVDHVSEGDENVARVPAEETRFYRLHRP
jgi:phosphodiesterase/alkaline phosphatase D-like protein